MEDQKGKEEIKKEDGKFVEELKQVTDNAHTCRVCWDEYHSPRNPARMLSCGHSFCTRCLMKTADFKNPWLEVNGGIRCPECRKFCRQEVATLPVNFQLMQLLSVLSLIKTSEDPEDTKGLPSLDFDALGTMLPENKLCEFKLNELAQHAKIVVEAMRRNIADDPKIKSSRITSVEYEMKQLDTVIRKFEECLNRCTAASESSGPVVFPPGHILQHEHFNRDPSSEQLQQNLRDAMEAITRRYIPYSTYSTSTNVPSILSSTRSSIPPMANLFSTAVEPPAPVNEHFSNDWMREMVVNRPTSVPPVEEVADVEAVMVQEQQQLAQNDAEGRSAEVVRDAFLRRERSHAQNSQRIQEQLAQAQAAIPQNPPRQRTRRFQPNQVAAIGAAVQSVQRQTARVNLEREIKATVAEKFAEEVRQEQETPAARGRMTRGEAVSILNLIKSMLTSTTIKTADVPAELRRIPFGHSQIEQVIKHIGPRDRDPNEMLRAEEIRDIRVFALAHFVQMDDVLEMFRLHAKNNAPPQNTIAGPSRQDEYNALLTIIRGRANEALEGKSPIQPKNEAESTLTARLVVNMAGALGVKEKLEEWYSTESSTSDFVPVVGKRATLFCNLCKCQVPTASKESHSRGKIHCQKLSQSRK